MALIARIKTWVSNEKLLYTHLNAEFDNVLDNLGPLKIDDYSGNTTLMQTQTDPGEVGTESLATTLAGEIARLRKMISELSGETYWYTSPATTLSAINASLNTITPDNRIVSGRVRTSEQQSIALVPNGAAATATLKGDATDFVYVIAGVQYTITSDVNITGLPTAAASNNTCLVNDAGVADTEDTKYLGEFGSTITVDAMGTSITGLVGTVAGFKINNGVTDEYFTAYVESTTTLTNVKRGHFFDSADATIPRIAIADNDTITLMKAAWVFAKTDLTLTYTATQPFVGETQPASPSANDYWFDTENDYWKKYDGVSWASAGATYVGLVLTGTANTVAARSEDYYEDVSDLNTIDVEYFSASKVRTKTASGKINVYGTQLDYAPSYLTWDMTLHLDSGLTEAASTIYYCYIKPTGAQIISTLAPVDRTQDLLGMYHPHHVWRCVGMFHNDASSNIEAVVSFDNTEDDNYKLVHAVAASALTAKIIVSPLLKFNMRDSTIANGQLKPLSILPGSQIVVSSGSTLGTTSAIVDSIYLLAVVNANRMELAISQVSPSDGTVVTTVAEGGAGAADSDTIIYSAVARTASPVKMLARAVGTQATAGTWASLMTSVDITKLTSNDRVRITPFTATGTYTKTYGVKQVIVITTGGGGGGGGSDTNGGASAVSVGGGGGAGSTCVEIFHPDQLAATETVTVGTGGAGGSAGGGNGSTGASSTFGTTPFHTAAGGLLGTGGGVVGAAGTTVAASGVGGTATNGLLNISGGSGGVGSANTAASVGGHGGASLWGGGGRGGIGINASSGGAGAAGVSYGSGGGGSATVENTGGAAGGAGADGYCLVIELF